MPTFCRHNRLIQNCPICSREQAIELRPVVSSSAPRATQPRPGGPRSARSGSGSRGGSPGGVRVRRLARSVEDGYQSHLVPGLKSGADAERLAEEVAFSATRLAILEHDPPGLYAEVADPGGDIEERTWLAFLIAYLCPVDGEDPFAWIAAVRTTWASGEYPVLDDVVTGPRTAHEPGRGTRTLEAYRAWAARSGSQAAAFGGDPAWAPERRMERVLERLSLPGLPREARYDFLVTLGRLGVHPVAAGKLAFGGPGEVTLAAKRALGIGDPLLLERRAAELAAACGVPIDVLDLALFNWGRGERAALGVDAEPDPELLAAALAALGLERDR